MADKITVGQLADASKAALNLLCTEVVEQINEIAEQVSKETANKLKAASPKMTGSYAKGWRQKVESVGVFGSQTRVIHNATDYQLTHLLEHGYIHHDTGRRVGQRAHIEAVEQESIADFTRKVEAL